MSGMYYLSVTPPTRNRMASASALAGFGTHRLLRCILIKTGKAVKPVPSARKNQPVPLSNLPPKTVQQKLTVLESEWQAERAEIMQGRAGTPVPNALRLCVYATLTAFVLLVGGIMLLQWLQSKPPLQDLLVQSIGAVFVWAIIALFFLSNGIAEHRRMKQYQDALARYDKRRAELMRQKKR